MKQLDDIELNEILNFEIKDLILSVETTTETYTYNYENELELLKRISYLLHRDEVEKHSFCKSFADSGVFEFILKNELKQNIIKIIKIRSIFLILDIICLLIFFNNPLLRVLWIFNILTECKSTINRIKREKKLYSNNYEISIYSTEMEQILDSEEKLQKISSEFLNSLNYLKDIQEKNNIQKECCEYIDYIESYQKTLKLSKNSSK